MPLSSGEGKGYMSATQAARLMGISPRHVYRLIENGHLIARHKNKRRLEIALMDIEAWIETHPREIDPLKQLEGIHAQLQQILERIGALENQFHAFKTSAEDELVVLREDILRGNLQETLNHLLTVLTSFTEQEDQLEKERADNNKDILSLPHPFVALQERIRRSLSALERRQLPRGTVTIASFAKQHGVKPRTALDHCKKNQTFTRYDRPRAKILKCEWWITPEQQGLLIRFWKQRQFPFEECQQCLHEIQVYSE